MCIHALWSLQPELRRPIKIGSSSKQHSLAQLRTCCKDIRQVFPSRLVSAFLPQVGRSSEPRHRSSITNSWVIVKLGCCVDGQERQGWERLRQEGGTCTEKCLQHRQPSFQANASSGRSGGPKKQSSPYGCGSKPFWDRCT